jgi:hypothetical protein
MTPSENCPDCGGTGYVVKMPFSNPVTRMEETVEIPCHCTKEHDGDGPDD